MANLAGIKRITAGALLILMVVSVSAQAGTTIVLNGGAPTAIVYNGQAAWEYVYDIYGQPYLNVALMGFDASLLMNTYNGQLHDKWESWTAGYNGGFSGWGMSAGPYPSYYDDTVGGWAINPSESAQSTYGYAYDATYAASNGVLNTWHSPDEYDGASIHAYNPGVINAPELGGESGVHFWYGIQSGWADDSDLYMTIRLVHPQGAYGMITYRPDGGDTMTVVGPGPGGNVGDFDLDGDVDADDIDLLFGALGGGDTFFDLTDDGVIDQADVDEWVFNVVPVGGDNVGTVFGDFNLDGAVDAGDLALLGGSFGQAGDFGWATGDATGDGVVDAGDLALLGGNFGTIVHPVPEPASAALLLTGVAALIKRRKS